MTCPVCGQAPCPAPERCGQRYANLAAENRRLKGMLARALVHQSVLDRLRLQIAGMAHSLLQQSVPGRLSQEVHALAEQVGAVADKLKEIVVELGPLPS